MSKTADVVPRTTVTKKRPPRIHLNLSAPEWIGKILDIEIERIQRDAPEELRSYAASLTRSSLAMTWIDSVAKHRFEQIAAERAVELGLVVPQRSEVKK